MKTSIKRYKKPLHNQELVKIIVLKILRDRSHKFNNKIALHSLTKAYTALKPLLSIRFLDKRSLSKLIQVMLNYLRSGKSTAKYFNASKFKNSKHGSLVSSLQLKFIF